MKRYLKNSFVAPNSIAGLKPILESWIDVQLAYGKMMNDEDHAWWYRERTCVGFLSAAAWQCGGVTLEEWQTKKGPRDQARHGRCDLYICRKNQEFFIEAKHMYSRATGNPGREMNYINGELKRAVSDASLLHCKRSLQLGVLFVAPWYPVGKQKGIIDQIPEWLRMVEEEVPHSAMAWLCQPFRKLSTNRGLRESPGVVLLASSTK